MTEPARPIIYKVSWTPVKEGKILFCKSKGHDLLLNVGGKPKPGENNIQALLREVGEESRAELDPTTIKFLKILKGQTVEGVDLHVTCYDAEPKDGNWTLVPSKEVTAFDWLDKTQKHLTTPMGGLVLDSFL